MGKWIITGISLLCLSVLITCCSNKPENPVIPTNEAQSETWGKPVNGLQCRITSDKETYIVNEPILVTFAIQNVSKEYKTYSRGKGDKYDYPETCLLIKTSTNKFFRSLIRQTGKYVVADIKLAPREVFRHTENLLDWHTDFPPDTYMIRVGYQYAAATKWGEGLTSNPLTIKVVEKGKVSQLDSKLQALVDLLAEVEGKEEDFTEAIAASEKLKEMGITVFPILINNRYDERIAYSCFQREVIGKPRVGDVCFGIIQSQVEVNVPKFYQQFYFLSKPMLPQWWEERSKCTLQQLQIEAAKYSLAQIQGFTELQNDVDIQRGIEIWSNRLKELGEE